MAVAPPAPPLWGVITFPYTANNDSERMGNDVLFLKYNPSYVPAKAERAEREEREERAQREEREGPHTMDDEVEEVGTTLRGGQRARGTSTRADHTHATKHARKAESEMEAESDMGGGRLDMVRARACQYVACAVHM